jgi:hypothetical protein
MMVSLCHSYTQGHMLICIIVDTFQQNIDCQRPSASDPGSLVGERR